jgi:hypothetical protein
MLASTKKPAKFTCSFPQTLALFHRIWRVFHKDNETLIFAIASLNPEVESNLIVGDGEIRWHLF